MKRSFSTVACTNESWKEIVDCASQAHMSAIEIRLDNAGKIFGLEREELNELQKYLRENNIAISDLGTSISLVEYDLEKIIKVKEYTELANLVGARGIRIFLGNFSNLFSDCISYHYEGIVSSLKEICDYADKLDVEIWIETHNEFSTGEKLRNLIDDVEKENLKVIWDIMHPIEKGEQPEVTIGFLGNRIAHVHIKDGKKNANPDCINYVYTKLGEGELPIEKIVKLLMNAEYEGYYSLEWERMWRSEIRELYECLEMILADYNFFMDGICTEPSSNAWEG